MESGTSSFRGSTTDKSALRVEQPKADPKGERSELSICLDPAIK